jgi:hypothetical protein
MVNIKLTVESISVGPVVDLIHLWVKPLYVTQTTSGYIHLPHGHGLVEGQELELNDVVPPKEESR